MVAATMARADSQTVAGKRFVGTARRRCLPSSPIEIASVPMPEAAKARLLLAGVDHVWWRDVDRRL